MYAVMIPALNSMVFLDQPPGEGPWDVVEGAEVDIPLNIHDWPEDTDHPEAVLCRSIDAPRVFKVYRQRQSIDPTEYEPTGHVFGGVFSRRTWTRFANHLRGEAEWLESRRVPRTEEVQATSDQEP